MHIGICDDNCAAVERLADIIKKWASEKSIEVTLHCFFDGRTLLAFEQKLEVLFLDVEMPEVDGNQVALTLRKREKIADEKLMIIYMTAYSGYMSDAFSVHAFDYLAKPFSDEKVMTLMDDVAQYLDVEKKTASVLIKTLSGLTVFKTREILYFERIGRQIDLVTTGETHKMNTSLTQILEQMQPFHFEQCYKSIIVNLYHVKQIDHKEILLTEGSKLPLSRNRSTVFRKSFCDYVQGAQNSRASSC